MMQRPLPRRALLLGLSASLLAACASNGRPTLSYLNGNAFYLEKIQYPRDKTLLRLRLLDITDSEAAPAVLAEQSLEKIGTSAAYSLCYDASSVQAGHRYVVDARLFVDGELRMQGRELVSGMGIEAAGPQVRLQMIAAD
ncbi:YbaY family lipoprotein [Vogesella oryzae]|uniref:YbaY family lipoprotein n=1 Tax=Vogesella oryzae TaxID=1735285 RepID=UPI0015835536|nr:YbaY family lipoprotein [Vogesella oryzae]